MGVTKTRVARLPIKIKYAGVAELADALALGASVTDVQVQVLSPAPYRVFITNLSYGHSIFYTHFYFVTHFFKVRNPL